MSQNRRTFLRRLAVVPLAVLPISVLGHEGNVIVTDVTKRHIFCFPQANPSQAEMDRMVDTLKEKGYKDALVLAGSAAQEFELYEVEK